MCKEYRSILGICSDRKTSSEYDNRKGDDV